SCSSCEGDRHLCRSPRITRLRRDHAETPEIPGCSRIVAPRRVVAVGLHSGKAPALRRPASRNRRMVRPAHQTPMNHASSESDVLVIGGGPAGASIARLLALRGWHVVVVSRAIDGQRGLAETLPPSTRKVLAAVGLLEAVEQASAFRSIGNAVWWGSDDGRLEDFAGHDDRPGLQVWRPELDRLLQVEAVRAGVEWITGNVIGVELETSPVRVRVTRPDGSTLDRHASFVVDATGRTGVGARSARRTAGAPRTHAWIGLWTCPSKTTLAADVRTLVETTDEGWIWSVPAAPGTRCVAVMVDPDRT